MSSLPSPESYAEFHRVSTLLDGMEERLRGLSLHADQIAMLRNRVVTSAAALRRLSVLLRGRPDPFASRRTNLPVRRTYL